MRRNVCASRASALAFALVVLPVLLASGADAQISPARAAVIENAIGARVEALTILGGDFGLSDGNFHSTGSQGLGSGAPVDTRITKFGGDGDVGSPKALDGLHIGWQPTLQGNMGYLESATHLRGTLSAGDTSTLRIVAVEFGGGVRFWTTRKFSIAPSMMVLYGHANNSVSFAGASGRQAIATLESLGLVDWSVSTWSLRPAVDLQYVQPIGRILVTFSSDATGFYTHGFGRSNAHLTVGGASGFVTNKVDLDVPLGIAIAGHELRTGGYISRTDLLGDLESGLGVEHLNELHGRLVLDFLNQWTGIQWLGVGASYLWGPHIHGWTAGADVAFHF